MSDQEDRRSSRRRRSRSRSPRRSRHEDDEFHRDILVVTGLPKTAHEGVIKRAFSDYGDVKRITIITDEVFGIFFDVYFSQIFIIGD
jgi:RNA recognition motif-containing protein